MISFLQTWKWHLALGVSAIVLCISLLANTTPNNSAHPDNTFQLRSFSLSPSALQAQAAIVYDPATGEILYAKNADLPLPLASLTKLMSAEVVLANGNPETPVAINSAATATINDPGDEGIKAGQIWPLGALVRYGLYASSNNAMLAAVAASDSTNIVDAMNARAQAQGLATIHFYNATGLDMSGTLAGGYGSARDMALLAANFYHGYPSYFEDTMSRLVPTGLSDALAADPTAAPIADIPGVLAAKTGYTDLAEGNMVAVFDVSLGHPLVAVVLHSTKEGRFQDIRTLISAARASQ